MNQKITVKVVNHTTNEVLNVSIDAVKSGLDGIPATITLSKWMTKDGTKVESVDSDKFGMMLAVSNQFGFVEDFITKRGHIEDKG